MGLCWLLDGEDDLVLEDEGLHTAQNPPEHHKDGQVLDPGKLEQLPEAGEVGDGEDGIRELQIQGEVTHGLPRLPNHLRLLHTRGHCNNYGEGAYRIIG